MRKIFILGGSSLQLDLILEAKKMFFYTIVLDMDENCIGAKWCDEFLHINIADKEAVLEKAREYQIDVILTSATELGNLTACYVGEKLGLHTNSYQTALATTNKVLMKEICLTHNINIAPYCTIVTQSGDYQWNTFPCIVKPSDSSGGRGVSYCDNTNDLKNAIKKATTFSKNNNILIEQYIKGEQYSVETISTHSTHQIVTITKEYIREVPEIVETHQTIPANIDSLLQNKIEAFALKILEIFKITFGACHIELRIDKDENIYFIEIASRVGGWRTELLNLAYGISYSQLLLFSALGISREVIKQNRYKATVKIILSHNDFLEYESNKQKQKILFEPVTIEPIASNYLGMNLCEAKGYYFILEKNQGNL